MKSLPKVGFFSFLLMLGVPVHAETVDEVAAANISDGKCAYLLVFLSDKDNILKGGTGPTTTREMSKLEKGALVGSALGYLTTAVTARSPDKRLSHFMNPPHIEEYSIDQILMESNRQKCGKKLMEIGNKLASWGQLIAATDEETQSDN
ncbi:MAG: hypothetical protein AAF067_13365 [Pseudomonadota bacterium]